MNRKEEKLLLDKLELLFMECVTMAVCNEFSISYNDIFVRYMPNTLVDKRQIAIYLIRTHSDIPMRKILSYFNLRPNSTKIITRSEEVISRALSQKKSNIVIPVERLKEKLRKLGFPCSKAIAKKRNKIIGYTPIYKKNEKGEFVLLNICYKREKYLNRKRKQLTELHDCHEIDFKIKYCENL